MASPPSKQVEQYDSGSSLILPIGIIPVVKADKHPSLEAKNALVRLVQALSEAESKG
ncbi:MAG: hypothetical protein NTX46_05875 [Chloroflexi bacterium]|nr:hypothetical protein [Chloroflexota bacterium]